MVSYKEFIADGSTKRFLVDFYIQNEEFTRPYACKYDNSLPIDGSMDHLEDVSREWSYPDNLWVRGGVTVEIEDLIPSSHWGVVDNSILFYTTPDVDTKIYIEVATRAEELGNTLVYEDVIVAKLSASVAQEEADKARIASEEALISAKEAEEANTFSYKWSSEEFNVPIDDGTRQGHSSYHWARIAESSSNGLKLAGVWNPNTDTFTPEQPTPVVDGMYWVVSEGSTQDIYSNSWLEGDLLVYLTTMTPDPYVKQAKTVHWNNVEGKPNNFIHNKEYTSEEGDDTFNIDFTPGSSTISINGITLAPSDYVEGSPDVEGVAHSITLNTPAKQGDTIYISGVEFMNKESDITLYLRAQSRVLTADSYATEPENSLVLEYVSNGDGTYSTTETSDYSSLHYSVKAYREKKHSEAEKLTADSYANEAEDTNVKEYHYDEVNDIITYTSSTSYSSLHWEEKAKASAESTDPSTIIHTIGSGLPNEGYNKEDVDSSLDLKQDKASLLDAIKNIDGEGSEIDADLVRGLPADFTSSLSENGYQVLPSGLIIQWKTFTSTSDDIQDFTFAIAFPNSCFKVFITNKGIQGTSAIGMAYGVSDKSPSGFSVDRDSDITGDIDFEVLAIGY